MTTGVAKNRKSVSVAVVLTIFNFDQIRCRFTAHNKHNIRGCTVKMSYPNVLLYVKIALGIYPFFLNCLKNSSGVPLAKVYIYNKKNPLGNVSKTGNVIYI